MSWPICTQCPPHLQRPRASVLSELPPDRHLDAGLRSQALKVIWSFSPSVPIPPSFYSISVAPCELLPSPKHLGLLTHLL